MSEKRKCSKCGALKSQIYVFNDGEFYACSDACRDYIAVYTYLNTWDELSQDFCEESETYTTNESFYYTEFN
jgi:hypothetical protein